MRGFKPQTSFLAAMAAYQAKFVKERIILIYLPKKRKALKKLTFLLAVWPLNFIQ